jgi:LysM repeat protein
MPARTISRLLAAGTGLALVAVSGQASFSGSVTTSEPVHVVEPGESLWGIAATDGLTVDQVAGANGLSPDAWLQPGMVLNIPPAWYTPDSSASSDSSDSSSYTSSTDSSSTDASSTDASSTDASSTDASSTDSSGDFCSTFVSSGGPEGVLPTLLSESPDRLALRPLFVEYADEYGVSPALVEAIAWQESGWQEGVVSDAQAVGVGQIIPSTAAFINQDLIGENLDDTQAADNIQMSAAFLGYLNQVEQGNLCNIIAAYYEGPDNLAADGVFTISQPYIESVEALIPRFE